MCTLHAWQQQHLLREGQFNGGLQQQLILHRPEANCLKSESGCCMAGRLVFFKFQIRLSFNPLRDGPALLSGKLKLPLKTVITFSELDKVSLRRPEMNLSLLLIIL